MAKRILVPLDQTVEAESVVELVAEAARGGGATVRLLHVGPLPDNVVDEGGRVVAYADRELLRLEAEALDYLRAVELQLDGVPVECAVRFGDAAGEILLEAEEFGADLIAMTTSGLGLLGRLVLGGVAANVFRKTETAVVMYRRDRGRAA